MTDTPEKSTETPSSESTRSGYAALCGRPNVGKSTLLNRLVGEKVAIVSPKPQTTRNRILGVCEYKNAQIVFLDTPGIHEPTQKLNEFMVEEAKHSAEDADVVLLMVDATELPTPEDRLCVKLVEELGKPTILVINKIDELKPSQVEARIQDYRSLGDFEHGVPISATLGTNVEILLDTLISMLPESPWLYPPGTATDAPIKFTISELIREQVLFLTREEIPYSVAVLIDEMEERSDELTYIRATIYVERDSQKGIVIGEGGRMLKQIGQRARQQIEELLGKRVYLQLWVKVAKNWRKNEAALRRFGYFVRRR